MTWTSCWWGKAYPIVLPILSYLDLLTDDVESNYPTNSTQYQCLVTGAGVFTWAEDMYERLEENTKTPINTWEYYYARIMGCNVVLDNIDAAIGDVSKKGNVKGQALTMRAYYHFMLVNLFARPYSFIKGAASSKSFSICLYTCSKVARLGASSLTADESINGIPDSLERSIPSIL